MDRDPVAHDDRITRIDVIDGKAQAIAIE